MPLHYLYTIANQFIPSPILYGISNMFHSVSWGVSWVFSLFNLGLSVCTIAVGLGISYEFLKWSMNKLSMPTKPTKPTKPGMEKITETKENEETFFEQVIRAGTYNGLKKGQQFVECILSSLGLILTKEDKKKKELELIELENLIQFKTILRECLGEYIGKVSTDEKFKDVITEYIKHNSQRYLSAF